jgi:hypothetical protein
MHFHQRSLTKLFIFLIAAEGRIWCVASPRATEAALQDGLNYACGQGGVDCSAIQPGGSCFQPDTVLDHASYAFNSFFQKDVGGIARCDFGGTAILSYVDPSTPTCMYPSAR